jgi:hypothetical protein
VPSERTRVLKIGWSRSGVFLYPRSQSCGTGFLVWRAVIWGNSPASLMVLVKRGAPHEELLSESQNAH